jgi:hypothetical protein
MKMLLKNGKDLSKAILGFMQNSEHIDIFAPYIKLATLQSLINNHNNCSKVFVRWEPKDLITGASDIEIYPYLKNKNIVLFRNPRIHLKAYLSSKSCLLTTANISSRALDLPSTQSPNYEIGTIVENLTIQDRLYFKSIEQESILITDKVFDQIKEQLEKHHFREDEEFKIEISSADKDFLVSALPMSYSISRLVSNYESIETASPQELDCLIHDLSLYNIPLGLGNSEMLQKLTQSFFNHKFIQAFLRNLGIKDEIYFGEAKSWIQKNCANVPIPRRWELTENTQILFRWIVELSKGQYKVDRPNYSERLYKINLHDD